MLSKEVLKSVLFFLTVVKYAHSLDLFIETSKYKNHEQLTPLRNKSYEMPLFQTRYVTIRVHANDLHRSDHQATGTVIGFKFELKSTDTNIIKMEKIIPTQRKSTNNIDLNTVLIEDLYICKCLAKCTL